MYYRTINEILSLNTHRVHIRYSNFTIPTKQNSQLDEGKRTRIQKTHSLIKKHTQKIHTDIHKDGAFKGAYLHTYTEKINIQDGAFKALCI